MIRLAHHDDGFRVTDPAKNTVRVRATDWETGVDAAPITPALARHDMGPDEPETTLTGRATCVKFPPVYAVTTPVGEVDHSDFGGNVNELTLPPDDYLIRIEASVRVFLRVEASITLRRRNAEALWIEFPEPTAVSFAFSSHVDLPTDEIIVPETPEGVATALTALPAANETTSPDRTWPTLRNRPPAVRFGEETRLPESVFDGREDTGIEAILPPDLDALLPMASLVHYLGAEITVEPDADPLLDIDGREKRLGTGSRLTETASDILRRCFYLDCVARTAGPHGGPLSVERVFDTLELDAERLYDASLAERARTYLDRDFDSVAEAFPEWHLSMYVEPTYEHVGVLPHIVDTLPFFFHPTAEPLTKKKWLALGLTGSGYETFQLRGGSDPEDHATPGKVGREVSNVNLVNPELRSGRTHGWLADGVPVDGFKSLPEAYKNRDNYLDNEDPELSVTVVVNDTRMTGPIFGEERPGMEEEREATVEHYERRAESLNIELTVRERVRDRELARIFESKNDLVHFVGHHTEDGLECSNRMLSADQIDRSRTQTFFLNACGSYPFGQALVRKGSVAGGVTFESIPDDDAFAVGSTFAGLITLGYSVSRGLAIASRQTFAPKDYAVVGDGTHRLMQSDSLVPPEMELLPTEEGSFEAIRKNMGPGWLGSEIHSSALPDNTTILTGETNLMDLTESELLDTLKSRDSPTVFKGELYWPEELSDIIHSRQ